MIKNTRILPGLSGLCLLFTLLTISFGYSQEIARSVISPYGTSGSTNGIYLSQTAGQASAYTTSGDDKTTLRQGFQQPLMLASGAESQLITITVYPNPNNGSFSFAADLPRDDTFAYSIHDGAGKDLYSGKGNGQEECFVTLSEATASGTYYIRVQTGKLSGSTEIIVIH